MFKVRGERPRCAAVLLPVLHHGKSNSTDESITEMNEDGSAMIREARRPGLVPVTAFANVLLRPLGAHYYYWSLKASKVSVHAANEITSQHQDTSPAAG